MAVQPQNILNTGKSDKIILDYISPNTIILDLPFILTRGKRLTKSMPYLKSEKFLADTKINAVRLLDFWDMDGFVHLKVQDLQTSEIDTLSWNLEYDGSFWLWCLADFQTLIQIANKK